MPGFSIFNDTFFAMGTRCDVVFPGIDNRFGELILQRIKTEVFELENLLSRFIPGSEISIFNKAPKNKWFPVSEKTWDILILCFDFYQLSNGAFDISAGALVSVWKNNRIPSKKEIERAHAVSGFNKVEFDFNNKRIKFLVEGIQFDLGAIGKGIALDNLHSLLKMQGIKNGIISFGESSVLAMGTHPNGTHWPLGIRNPFNPAEFMYVFETKDQCITTSGTIILPDDGMAASRNHIVNPVYGSLVEKNKSVSVKSASATMGEFVSTSWLVLPENDREILSEKFNKLEILEVEYLENNDYTSKLTMLK